MSAIAASVSNRADGVASDDGSGVEGVAVGSAEGEEAEGELGEVVGCGEGSDAGSAPIVQPDSRSTATAARGTLLTASTLLGER